MKNIFLIVVVAALITGAIALATTPQSADVENAESISTATVAPTASAGMAEAVPMATVAPTEAPAPEPTPQTLTTVWVSKASGCSLPQYLWNRGLYSVEKPQFTPGSAFKLEMPEFWIIETRYSWTEPEKVVALKNPPMITGGQDVYCNFRAWQETRQLVLP